MSLPIVSVIVPVYNTEKYLPECIESVLFQSYTDFELLLIDDGSTDGSGLICDEYARKDFRIKVVHKSNGGVSSARNEGLDIARGEYVCFVDSDDWVCKDYLKNLVLGMKRGTDLVIAALADGTSPSYSTYFDLNEYFRVYSRLALIYSPCAKLFRNKIIIDSCLRFDTNVNYGEDTLFNLAYLLYAKQITLIPESNYYPRPRMGSLGHYQYDFECEYSVYKKFYKSVNLLIGWRKIKDSDAVSLLYALVCRFSYRALNAIYRLTALNHKERRKLLRQIDTNLIGKYLYPQNAKERIIKYLFAMRLEGLYDFMRIVIR